MVTRKPLPEHPAIDPALLQQAREAWSPNGAGDDAPWGNEALQRQPNQQGSTNPPPTDIPNSLRPGTATSLAGLGEEDNVWAQSAPALVRTDDLDQVPAVLRPGSSHGRQPRIETSAGTSLGPVVIPLALRPGGDMVKPETNPFKRKKPLSGQAAPSASVPPLPVLPIDDFSQLSLGEPNSNPWQPTLGENKAPVPLVPRLPEQDSAGDNVWASAKPSRQPTPGLRSTPPVPLALASEDGPAGWGEEPKQPPPPPPLVSPIADGEGLDDAHTWEDLKPLDKGKGLAPLPPLPNQGGAGSDEWNLIDLETRPEPPSRQSTWENFRDEDNERKTAPTTDKTQEQAAALLRPASKELPPPPPPRPVDKSETYQIKNINWHDSTAAKNPRTSPILVQNANGPCPLVALVNALTLTTPADVTNTALVETLRSREQVSLGLLLDAVFDELMSERRTQPDVPLPDVTELYDFLKGLHTGMNVNPRFIPAPEVVRAFERTSLTHLPLTERADMIPGTFEHTNEMVLYSTFAIPLIHGWLPSKTDAVYEAFSRQAESYEDAQNLLFREEELEEKLCNHHHGLSPDEQQVYQDVLTIKSFLNISATQLTRFGLDVIRKAMKPGAVAILFRNDHFSTLYRHPQTLELLTLVTDAGYAGHAEVVWESLVDVNGESAEFFSGDFRLVGGATHDQQPHSSTHPDDGGYSAWTTVPSRRGRTTHTPQASTSADPPLSPTHEQEDRDLALALQLQEEEDERARADQARRRRESILSEQYIEQQARSGTTTSSSNATPPTTAATAVAQGLRGTTAPSSHLPTPRTTTTRNPSHSTTSLTSSTGSSAHNGRTRTARASSTSITTTQSPAAGAAGGGNRTRPTTQTVRSLLPPRTVPATNRPTPDEGLDDAPPSYEQAAKQLPYVPPAGHPSHPASSPAAEGGAGGEGSSSAVPRSAAGGGGGGRGRGGTGGRGGGAGGYSGSGFTATGAGGAEGRGYRRGVPPAPVVAGNGVGVGSGGGRERECVVM